MGVGRSVYPISFPSGVLTLSSGPNTLSEEVIVFINNTMLFVDVNVTGGILNALPLGGSPAISPSDFSKI